MLAVLVALLAGSPGREVPPAVSAEEYVAEWADAWSRGDPYDVARFYSPDVLVRYAQPDLELTNPASFSDTTTDGEGRAWLASWFADHTHPHAREVFGVFVDSASLVTVLTVDDLDAAVLMMLDIDDSGMITRQSTLRWRDAQKPSGLPDPRLAWLDDLVAEHLREWDDGAVAAVSELTTGDLTGPALFVVPGTDTAIAAFVTDVVDSKGCHSRMAVVLTLDSAGGVAERRFSAPDAVCGTGRRPSGPIADGLPVPAPVDEQVTGVVSHPDGSRIPLFNSSEELERLAAWGLERFVEAGLDPPVAESFTFAPVAQCASLAGVVVEAPASHPDLILCTDAYAACVPDRASCTSFDVSARFGLLHELAHIWLVEHVDDAGRRAFLTQRGLDVWRDAATPWHRRGVEHAAEILAWGLMDEEVELIRLGSPPCHDLTAGYALITGKAAPRACPAD